MTVNQNGSNSGEGLEVATLGGGCFWCIEPAFGNLQGVESSVSGYAGGHTPNPTYEQVCSGRTGHAEVVQVRYDPQKISYRDILSIFFTLHDPTTLNRQGADSGTQYRSIILYDSPEQKQTAEQVIRELENEHVFDKPIVTQVVPLDTFYRAEEYHQDYFAKNPSAGYCRVVVAPKIAKFRKRYSELLKV